MNTAKSAWEATKSDYKTACIEDALTQLLNSSGMSSWYSNYEAWPTTLENAVNSFSFSINNFSPPLEQSIIDQLDSWEPGSTDE